MKDVAIADWLASLADRTPTPGGGAAAALLGATSAALVGMVTSYTTGPRYAEVAPRMAQLNAEAAVLRVEALSLAERDEAAFGAVSRAYQLPKETEADKAQRSAEIQRALAEAAVPPTETGRLASRLVAMAAELVDAGNPNVVSDVAVASAAARAAIESAAVNVAINRAQLKDPAVAAELDGVLAELAAAAQAAGEVTRRVQEKISS